MAAADLEARWPRWPDGEEGKVALDVVLDLPVDQAFLLLYGGLTELRVGWWAGQRVFLLRAFASWVHAPGRFCCATCRSSQGCLVPCIGCPVSLLAFGVAAQGMWQAERWQHNVPILGALRVACPAVVARMAASSSPGSC